MGGIKGTLLFNNLVFDRNWYSHYKKRGLKLHFKNAVIASKNVAIGQFGL